MGDSENAYIIRCTNVPVDFFKDTSVAKNYFLSFGKVRAVKFKRKSRICFVEFHNEDSMLNALEGAGEYMGQFFKVYREHKAILKKKRLTKQDPNWIPDPDVRAELEAMGGVGIAKKYNLRPELMQIDTAPVIEMKEKVPKLKRPWKSESTKKISKEIKSDLYREDDLLNVIKAQALTVEDKYRILDARDKLIRLRSLRFKKVDIKSGPTIGVCPDMCPEKERLMRETQHQVSLYEQSENAREMNPKLAVKQYSRSSADQEAPLPQELRPVGVLQMTMGYLMQRIMNLCDSNDVNMAEWYHFLWDRTRGIRKDITQQELCCQGSVELVEQCARFHIFCSARLVSEDPSVFDQKINTENLTKCLQTLKYMYHDLGLKGISCEHEAEFRAYIILLNLNDGNFMWEVQQLRPEIQHSPEVRFALEVYSAIDKNNYVKFFKLINRTTFLNACILMRYFTQIRICATKTFLKCYSPRATQSYLPIGDFTELLAFENIESAMEFIETYGLSMNEERTHIILDKTSFTLPEYPYVLDRAINLVESKRIGSIGEVVCGGKLPENLYDKHIPQNSFDEKGYLINLPIDPDLKDHTENQREEEEEVRYDKEADEEQEMEEEEEENVDQEQYYQEFDRPLENDYQEQENVTEDFDEGIEKEESENEDTQEQEEIEKEDNECNYVESEESVEENSKDITDGPFTFSFKTPFVSHPPQNQLETIFTSESIKQKEEELKIKQKELQEKLQRKLEEHRKLMEIKQRELEEKRKSEELEKLRQKQLEELKLNEIKNGVKETMENLIDYVDNKIRNDKLKTIKNSIKQRKLIKILNIWRRNVLNKRRKRKNLDFSPIFFSNRTIKEEAKELETNSQKLALSQIKRYKLGHSIDIEINYPIINPINLLQLTYQILLKKFLSFHQFLPKEIFWKITISLPNELKFKNGLNVIENTLNEYLKWGGKGMLLEQHKKDDNLFNYCIEKQKGTLVNSKNDSMGFIFIAQDLNDDVLERIELNLKNFGIYTQIPIVLLLRQYTQNENKLKLLKKNEIISNYFIINAKDDLTNGIDKALQFLGENYPKPPPLEMDTLKSFLSKYLCTEIWRKANSFAKWNSNYKDCLKDPNTVVYLHNEAVGRLKKILLDKTNREWAKFPKTFQNSHNQIPDFLPCDYRYFPLFWDHEIYLNKIEEVVNCMRLPKLINWPCGDELNLEITITKYCMDLFKNYEKISLKIMAILLRDIDINENFSDINSVLWTNIVEIIALEKLKELDFSLHGTGFLNQSLFNQLTVVYNKEKLMEFNKSDWFYVNHPIIRQKIQMALMESAKAVQKRKMEPIIDIDIDEIWENLQKPTNTKKLKKEFDNCKLMLKELEETIEIEKVIFDKTGKFLKSALDK